MTPCLFCCNKCYTLWKQKTSIVITFSGIVWVGCRLQPLIQFPPSSGTTENVSGTINGAFILPRIPVDISGDFEWKLISNTLKNTIYAPTDSINPFPCSIISTIQTDQPYTIRIRCNSNGSYTLTADGITILGEGASIFKATVPNIYTPVVFNMNTDNTGNSGNQAYGGVATLSW